MYQTRNANFTAKNMAFTAKATIESYREDGKVKHRTIRNLGLFDDDQVPYIKAAFAKKETTSCL